MAGGPAGEMSAGHGVAVVGGGIAGLSAAWALAQGSRSLRIVVVESGTELGGKLALGELEGVIVDTGAESMLARRPEAVALAAELGLGVELVAPRPVGAAVWSGYRLHPLPAGTLMGVPSRIDGLAGLLTAAEIAEVLAEPGRSWPALDDDTDDTDVASFVAGRLGPAVVERLVEPLLGGVYAGHADLLSLRATVPALWHAAALGRSLVDTAAEAVAAAAGSSTPVFNGLRGGVGQLPIALGDALREHGVQVRTALAVRRLERAGQGWRLVAGAAHDEQSITVDAVVLATPAAATARLLRTIAPAAASALAQIEYSSVGIVSLLLPVAGTSGLNGSGVLVPPAEGRFIKAATFSTSKWAWLQDAAPGQVVVRASVGRHREVRDLQADDADLVRRVLADLRDLPGVRLADPVASLVTRWGGALPQYAVGHLAAVDLVRRDVARLPGLAVAGAAYDGVGIAACIASGRRAAEQVLTHLAASPAAPVTMGP